MGPSARAALLVIADGRFPAGAHAHSAGAEAAVRTGDVADVASLARFLAGRLATTGHVDATFAAAACAATVTGGSAGAARSAALDAGLDARLPSPRLRDLSRRLGRQLARTGARVAPDAAWAALAPAPHQAVATGTLVAVLGGGPYEAALVSLHHLAAAVTGAAVRLLGLDPVAVAAVQIGAAGDVDALASRAAAAALHPVDDLPATAGALAEILGEHHGTWDDRLFTG